MLIQNSFLYVLARLIPGLVNMATTVMLTHLLEPERYGLYGLALIVMMFGSSTAFDWLGHAFLRFYEGRRHDPRVIATFAQIYLLLVIATASLLCVAWLLGAFSPGTEPFYIVGTVMMWAFSLFELMGRYQIANFRPIRYLIMNAGRAGFTMAGAGLAAWLTRDPVWTAAGTAIGTLGGVMLGRFEGSNIRWRSFDPTLAAAIVRFGFPLAISITMSGFFVSGTRALVEILDSPAALGVYTAAYLLIQNTLGIISTGVESATFSMAVRAIESGDPVAADRQVRSNGTILLAVLLPASIGLAITGHGIAKAFLGPIYVEPVTALTPWLATASFFGGFRASYLDHAFQLGRRPGLQIWVTGAAAVIALGLSFILIPKHGPLGAAMSLSCAMAFSCVHAWFAGRYAYRMPLPMGPYARIAVACLMMTLCTLAVPGSGPVALALQVIVGGITYTTCAVLLNVLDMRDRVLKTFRSVPRRLAGRCGF